MKAKEWEKAQRMNKKAAVELSIGTIVIIVLAMTMLILGLVLVRSIMCSAISLTGEVNKNVKSEITKLFESTAGEVVCLGSGDKPVTLVPGGDADIVYCSIRAPQKAKYTITVDTTNIGGTINKATVKSWIMGTGIWTQEVAPNDELPKKVIRINVPENAPEGSILMTVKIEKEMSGAPKELISTQELDFTVKRVGMIRSAVC